MQSIITSKAFKNGRGPRTLTAILSAVAIFTSAAQAMAAPVAVASAAPTTGPWPLPVQFTGDRSTGNIVKYWWYFGDGYTSSEANPLHTYNCYGTFPVYLTVTDDQGLTSTASLTIDALQVLYSASVAIAPVVKYQKNGTPASGTLTGTVVVKDSEGYTIQGATVEAIWTTPAGTTVTQSAISGSTATFSLSVPKGGSGIYTLQVTKITKAGTFFDATSGTLSASIKL